MLPITRVTSLSNARIKAVVKLRDQRERRRTGLLIAEGSREVARAAAAGLGVEQVYFCPQLLGDGELGDAVGLSRRYALDASAGAWFELSARVFRKIAYLREPEGLLAVVRQPGWGIESLDPSDERALYLVAVGTEKPGNLGAMVRTAEAGGCAAVLAAGAPVDAFNPNAIRASTAAVFALPTISAPARTVIDWLIQRGVRLAAAVAEGGTPHHAFNFAGPLAIVIGPEDRGLDQRWIDAATRSGGGGVTIATRGRVVDSLNASNAAAVLLFEARRQRDAT